MNCKTSCSSGRMPKCAAIAVKGEGELFTFGYSERHFTYFTGYNYIYIYIFMPCKIREVSHRISKLNTVRLHPLLRLHEYMYIYIYIL